MHATPKRSPLPLEPNDVQELLEQLATAQPRCLYCPDPVTGFDMMVAWPAAGVVAHFACYAQAQQLVRTSSVEASS